MERKHSVPIELVRSVLVASVPRELSLEQLLEVAGLNHLQELIEAPERSEGSSEGSNEGRVSLEDFGTLLRSLWLELGDESSGFMSRPLKIGTFGMMCHAIITSGNLRRALLRSARFIGLLTDDLYLELKESGTEARLLIHYDNPKGLDESFIVTSIFVIWIRLSCWLINQPLLLERINFRFAKPSYHDEFPMMFPCRQLFSQSENSVVFSRRLLALPLQQDAETLVPFLSHAPESLLTQFRDDESMTGQVKRLLLNRSGRHAEQESASFESVAETLHMTTHTVRRRLKDEGSSFQEIKDSIRRDRALHLLDKPDLSIQDIAERLGFSESAAFNRAFKKWTGYTPGAYRDQKGTI